MKKFRKYFIVIIATICFGMRGYAQSEIYPEHFDLEEVELTDGPFKTALDLNIKHLLKYDVDRLLTPFIREAGLSSKSGKYQGWTSKHPSFSNWGLSDWSLEGHIGGHYLTALALSYASCHDATTKQQLKDRLDYMLDILKDCQDAYIGNTEGMEGFIGGQPITQIWRGLYAKDLGPFKQYGGWVPFYCQHKVIAGLRDAWLYADSEVARDLFRGICDWAVNVVSNLTNNEMQDILGWEHGGMNEPLADAYRLFGDARYLVASKKYSHEWELNGMQSLNTTFLDGQHANTQVPKFIGFERIYQEYKRDSKPSTGSRYRTAAHNFWSDVANNRTVCIGGNSVSEHFLSASSGSAYINNIDGPETCNSNNMLKLSEMLFDETHSATYADFYEGTMWNHILSTQDPKTGGYVYFTSLRPQSYRIYSQVNQGMWCCVGTGMENHSKYSHFIYTHSADNKILYVNLFIASKLDSEHFALTQETSFPYSQTMKITIEKDGDYTVAIRHPKWAGADYSIKVNGEEQSLSVTAGRATYVKLARTWSVGDVIEVYLPMSFCYEACPNYSDYIAFKYGPILMAAQTTARTKAEATSTGLVYESLQNEYAGEGRMDHAPGSRASTKPLQSAPLLIGNRADVLDAITVDDASRQNLQFTLQASKGRGTGGWDKLTLVPFYSIHHARYQCYWYQQTEEKFLSSDMGKDDLIAAALNARTLDFVAPGEQQSEAGHEASYSNSDKGHYNNESYRDCSSGGYIQYTLLNPELKTDGLAVLCRFNINDQGRKCNIDIDGKRLVTGYQVPSSGVKTNDNGFFNVEFPIPTEMVYDASSNVKSQFVFKMAPNGTSKAPGLFYLRLVEGYDSHEYVFKASDWKTGDSGRVSQSNISYDTTANTITVKATGNNNVCLSLDYGQCDYNVQGANKYLLVCGEGLSLASGANYLWWLNGVNKGSQVNPTTTRTLADGKQVVAWDITKSSLDGNCKGDLWNVCQGLTIFGLTAPNGTATIHYIGFVPSVNAFVTGVEEVEVDRVSGCQQGFYNLQGVPVASDTKGIVIVDGKKVLRK